AARSPEAMSGARHALTCVALVGCALPQSPLPVVDGTVYQSTTDAMQYRSTQPRDARTSAPRHAHGQACRTMLAFPSLPPPVFMGSDYAAQYLPWSSFVATFGNDGFVRAVANARDSVGGAEIFDVRADLRTTAVLGVWRRECVEVHALAR